MTNVWDYIGNNNKSINDNSVSKFSHTLTIIKFNQNSKTSENFLFVLFNISTKFHKYLSVLVLFLGNLSYSKNKKENRIYNTRCPLDYGSVYYIEFENND